MKLFLRFIFVPLRLPRVLVIWVVVFSTVGAGLSQTTQPQNGRDNPDLTIGQRIDRVILNDGKLADLEAEIRSSLPMSRKARGDLVTVLMEEGRLADAIPILNQSVVDDPGDLVAWECLSEIDDELGDLNAASAALSSASQHANKPEKIADLQLRRALVLFDEDSPDEAVGVLRLAAQHQPEIGRRAALICFLYGRYADVAGFLDAKGQTDPEWLLLAGNAALRGGQAGAALSLFEKASALAQTQPQARYCIERIVTAQTQLRGLSRLADSWLAQDKLPANYWTPLAIVLRETGRTDDLLNFWKSRGADLTDAPLGFTSEVIGAASSSGKEDIARGICMDILRRDPKNAHWLKFTARALCDWGDAQAASELLDSRVSATDDATTIVRLATLARDLGLRDVVATATGKLIRLGNATAVQGMLLRAQSDTRFADYTAANASLTTATRFARQHPADISQVAGALEFAGRINDAIALLQSQDILALSSDEQSRLGALLSQQRNFDEARKVYEYLRRKGSSEALRSQFAMMMLDNAVAAHRLPETIVDLKALIAGGNATAEDVTVLSDAFSRSRDPAAAISLLKTNSIMDEKTRLRQLSILLLRAKRRADAIPVLKQMVEVDPDGAIEHLEELAVSASELRDVTGAAEYVAEIRRRVGADQSAFEVMGHVYDRLNRPADSAVAYRKAIALGADDGDLWLQWTSAMSKSGQTDAARLRLQVLARRASDAPMFGIAADAVLNLRPPPFTTQSLRREAILRLTTSPRSMLLFHVVSDLADELKDHEFETRCIEAGMPFNDDERDPRLRDLSAIAIDQPDNLQETLSIGRSMILIGDHFPSKEFIDLGTAMLDAHRPPDALIFFNRAVQETTEDRVALHVVDSLADFGQYDAALTVAIPLKPRHAFDPDFRLSMALIEETAGQTHEAFEDYSASLDIELHQITSRVVSEIEGGQEINLRAATAGAIATARSPKDADSLLQMLSAHAGESGAASEISLAIFRQVAFALHRPEAVEQMLPNPPADSTFASIRGRMDAGLIDSAITFAANHNASQAIPAFAAWIDDFPADTLANRIRYPSNPNYVSIAIRGALAVGDFAQAARLARAFPFPRGSGDARFYTLTLNAAQDAGDHELSNTLALQLISSSLSGTGRESLNTLNTIQNTWRYLDADGRISLQKLLQQKFEQAPAGGVQHGIADLLLLSVAAINQHPTGDDVALAISLLPNARDANAIARIFVLTAPADRPALLKEIAKRLPADQRLEVYLACVANAFEPLDEATVHALCDAITSLPTQNKSVWSAWCFNSRQGSNLGLLADAVAKTAPKPANTVASIAPTTSCAMALSLAGRTPDADAMANIAINRLREWAGDNNVLNAGMDYFAFEDAHTDGPPARAYLLRIALAALSPAGRRALEENLNNLPHTSGAEHRGKLTPARLAWELTYAALVKESVGDQPASLALLKEARRLAPDNPSVQKILSDWLVSQGRYQELIWTFPDAFTGAIADARLSSLLALAARNLYRTESKFHNSQVSTVLVLPHFSYDAWAGDTNGLRGGLVRVLQLARMRGPRQLFGGPDWADPSAGGLDGIGPPRSIESLAAQPDVIDNILAVWPFQAVRQADWVRELLSRALTRDSSRVPPLMAELEKRADERILDNSDRDLLKILVGLPGVRVTQPIIDDAWRAAVFSPGDGTFAWVSTLLAQAREGDAGPSTRPVHRLQPRIVGAPIFGGRLPDQWASREISQSLAIDGAQGASDQLNSMIHAGVISPALMRVQVQAARIAAQSGDWDLMRERIRAAIFAWKGQPPPSVVDTQLIEPPDFAAIVPSSFNDPAAVDSFSNALLGEVQDALCRWPTENELVAGLARVGGRLQAIGQKAAARRFLAVSQRGLKNLATGDQTLCVADLAERLGDHATAQKLKIECLRARCLPIARIPGLLASVDPDTRNELRQFVPANVAQVTNQSGASEAAQ